MIWNVVAKVVVKVVVIYVIAEDVLFAADLDGVGDEAEDSTDPEQHGESSEEVLAEFHPFGRRLGRRQSIGTVALEDRLGLRHRQTLKEQNNSKFISIQLYLQQKSFINFLPLIFFYILIFLYIYIYS